MVSRIARTAALLLALSSSCVWAIDFTPIVPADDSPRMRRFPRLLFKDGARSVSYVRPAGWQFSGSKAGLRLEVSDPSHSIATIQEVARKSPAPFDDKTIEALEKRAEREPKNPEAFQMIAGYYYEETQGDARTLV